MKSVCFIQVRGYELDSFGHVNNAVYLQYAETAKWEFFNNSGLWSKLKELNYFPVILENHVRYIHSLHLLDTVRIDTEWKCSMGLVEFVHTFRNDATGQKVCKVMGKLALVDENEIICSIPENMRKYMEKNEL